MPWTHAARGAQSYGGDVRAAEPMRPRQPLCPFTLSIFVTDVADTQDSPKERGVVGRELSRRARQGTRVEKTHLCLRPEGQGRVPDAAGRTGCRCRHYCRRRRHRRRRCASGVGRIGCHRCLHARRPAAARPRTRLPGLRCPPDGFPSRSRLPDPGARPPLGIPGRESCGAVASATTATATTPHVSRAPAPSRLSEGGKEILVTLVRPPAVPPRTRLQEQR